ncbi:MAG TPA: HD domain-containing protein [Clostridia bacterium]|nr:HD domain-containing protein [Clostridia bacterium]
MSKLFEAYIKSRNLINNKDQDFFECVVDLLESDDIQSLEKFYQHQNVTRLEHILSVSYLSFLICRRLGLDFREAARGALLHDLFFYDWHESDPSHRLHGYRHPTFALNNARKIFGPLSPMTENIIIRHMWPLTPTPPKYKESFIVSFVDKYCTTQEILTSKFKRKIYEYLYPKN